MKIQSIIESARIMETVLQITGPLILGDCITGPLILGDCITDLLTRPVVDVSLHSLTGVFVFFLKTN